MRWTREQYIGLMTFGDFPRPMFVEPFGPLKMLADEWQEQGVPEDEVDRELTPDLVQQGGVAFGLDHRIPNGTSIENYRYYVHAARQRRGLPPADGKRRGWRRMAM